MRRRDQQGLIVGTVSVSAWLASSERVYVEGARVYETYLHDPDSVRRYALDDVREVDGLARRLMGAAFALAGMAPRRYERIASAGPAMGILEPLLVRAYLRAGAALPQSEHYVHVLRGSYAERLRVVFEAEDFSQLFRLHGQRGLFDRPIEQMQLRWIRCIAPKAKE